MDIFTPSTVAPIEPEFASRSARYLAKHGCTPMEIREVLIRELDLEAVLASVVVEDAAA